MKDTRYRAALETGEGRELSSSKLRAFASASFISGHKPLVTGLVNCRMCVLCHHHVTECRAAFLELCV